MCMSHRANLLQDSVDFDFGDATVSGTAVMDFLNVAVHEVGHAGGMAHPSDSCTEESMYRFVSFGETKKRDLHTGDIAGIQSLY
ncbi:MAG: peptidase M10A and M12B matrixin and adamalysin [Parcubacteria group bacterium Gr01-1014_38]|nr:MAG: peptidase M10A and M12B matrixin and adamalysin [Parcubacteria group bacterium Gr01-1014_38]